MHFLCLENKDTNWIYETCCIKYVFSSIKCHIFHNVIFSCSHNIHNLHKSVVKFKCPTLVVAKGKENNLSCIPVNSVTPLHFPC